MSQKDLSWLKSSLVPVSEWEINQERRKMAFVMPAPSPVVRDDLGSKWVEFNDSQCKTKAKNLVHRGQFKIKINTTQSRCICILKNCI